MTEAPAKHRYRYVSDKPGADRTLDHVAIPQQQRRDAQRATADYVIRNESSVAELAELLDILGIGDEVAL